MKWEVEAAIRWLKAGTAPGEDGVTPDMVVAAGQPMRRVLIDGPVQQVLESGFSAV
jgi:hypothetical protein